MLLKTYNIDFTILIILSVQFLSVLDVISIVQQISRTFFLQNLHYLLDANHPFSECPPLVTPPFLPSLYSLNSESMDHGLT